MNLLTFAEAKASRLKNIASACPSSTNFKELVNDATRMLMRRGNYWGTVQKIQICTYNGCITWPRYVGTVLAMNIASTPIQLWNNWYSFEPIGMHDFGCGGFSFCKNSCSGNVNGVNDGVACVFNPIPCGSANKIRAYTFTQTDVGKKVTIFGIDNNGQTIRTKRIDGSWQDGVELTLAIPYVETNFGIQRVDRITKDVTQGMIRYYQYDATNNVLLDLVSHDPTETSPVYRHTRIIGFNNTGCNCGTNCNTTCGGLVSVNALVKLDFVPVVNDLDLILISNLDALKDMVMSIKEKEAGNLEKALALEASAVHELNLELRDKFPNTQTPVNVMPFGTARLQHQGIGTLM